MSATPRTDEAWAKRFDYHDISPWTLCMKLEIELNEADQKWERRLIAALGGHADSKLWGDDGLIAATWRCVEGYEKMEKELAEARNILKQCLSIMPVGHIPTHTTESLTEMIGDLAKALAEETTEREQLERELAEAREQRDHYKTACDQYSEDESLNMLAEARSAVKNLTHCIISAQGVDAVGRCVALIRRQEEILGPLGPINDFRLAELLSHSLQQPAELKITQLTKQRDTLAEQCRALLDSDEVQKAWPLDGTRRAEKPSDTHSSATVTVKFRRLLAIHSALAAVKGGVA